VFAALVIVGPGRRCFRRGIPALLRGAPDLNSLVALGLAAAYGCSAFVLAAPELLPEKARNVYFEYACGCVVLTLVGYWLSARRDGRSPIGRISNIPSGAVYHNLTMAAPQRNMRLYVMAALLLVILSAIVWSRLGAQRDLPFALIIGGSVLMIACPGAVALARPISIGIGLDRAARKGILMRDRMVLQRLPKISLLVFDAAAFLEDERHERQLVNLGTARAVKNDAKAITQSLQTRGVRVALLSDTDTATTEALAQQFGINLTVSNILPSEQAVAIERLRNDGDAVGFLGADYADLSKVPYDCLRITAGVASDSADIVLMRGDPAGVLVAMNIADATVCHIRQNVLLAFGFNAMLIPIAAGVFYQSFGIMLSPGLAMGAMGASTLCILCNALRLRRGGG